MGWGQAKDSASRCTRVVKTTLWQTTFGFSPIVFLRNNFKRLKSSLKTQNIQKDVHSWLTFQCALGGGLLITSRNKNKPLDDLRFWLSDSRKATF